MKEGMEDEINRLLKDSNMKTDFFINQLREKVKKKNESTSLSPEEAFVKIDTLIKELKAERLITEFCTKNELNYHSLMSQISAIKNGKKPVDFFPNLFLDILKLIYSNVTLKKEKFYTIKKI